MFKESFKGISRKFQGRLREISVGFKVIGKNFKGKFREVSKAF